MSVTYILLLSSLSSTGLRSQAATLLRLFPTLLRVGRRRLHVYHRLLLRLHQLHPLVRFQLLFQLHDAARHPASLRLLETA